MRWEVRTMRSKSSFFDKAVYGSVLCRNWFISVGYAVVMAYRLMQYVSRGNWQYRLDSGLALLLRTALSQCVIVCAAGAAVTAMLVYRWLFFPRYTAFVSALPIRRETVFFSQMAAGFTLLTAGNIFAILFVSALGVNGGAGLMSIWLWLVVMTLLTVFFFGFASFCALLTGSILILPAVYTVLLYAAVALEASARLVVQYLVFGLTGQRWLFTVLSPVYHLRAFADRFVLTEWQVDEFGHGSEVFVRFLGWPTLLGYSAAGLLFAFLAVALLRRRRMESAGAVVAVPWLRNAFCWCAALAGAFTLGFAALRLVFGYSGYISVGGSFPRAMLLLLIMLLGAFLGWFGARGLMHKSVRVFNGGWKGFAAFCAMLSAFVLGMETDVLGVERAVPKAEDVGYVTVLDTYGSVDVTTLREKENIAAAIELQTSIVSHKALFERLPIYGYNWGGVLEISYYDHDGSLLFNRAYAAPEGVMAWSSAGNARSTDGNAWGSANPDLKALEDLLNCREAVEQRLTVDQFPASAYTASSGYIYRLNNGQNTFNLELDGAQTWELYRDCLLPDSADSSMGRVRLLPAEDPNEPQELLNVNLFFTKHGPSEDDMEYDTVFVTVPPDAKRTNAWLIAHGYTPAEGENPVGEPPVTNTYELPELEGLSALLEKIYLEYDPTAAGTVVSVRWTRSLLEWYASERKDPAAAQEAAALFARRYVITEGFLGSLNKLRAAGEQLVCGQSGLVRDHRFADFDAATVDELFDAVLAGFSEA